MFTFTPKLWYNQPIGDIMNLTKIYDIAGAAGVSLATVSRVLNHPEKVKKETREKILKIIKDRGYKPNANARSLASKRSTTIAVVVPTLTRSSVSEVIQSVLARANEFGYSLRIFTSDLKSSNLSEEWLEIASFSVDGILVIADEITKEFQEIIKSTFIPVVFMNLAFKTFPFSTIGIDDEQAGYFATKLLIDNGRKNIFFITTKSQEAMNKDKEKGYLKALSEHGLTKNILTVPGDLELNTSVLTSILDKEKIDGVISTRDSIAINFMNIAIKKGVKVPDDIEFIGFQNTRYALLSNPSLTCVKIPVTEIGGRAVDILTKQIAENTDPENIVLPFEIIKRNSTK